MLPSRRAHAAIPAALALIALAAVSPSIALAQGTPAPAANAAARNTLPLKPARSESFTTSKGTWISLDLSPDGQTIVFDMLGHLYTMPAAGGTATALTSGLAYDAQPRFSPDGKKIVFVSDRSGGDNVWIMSLDKSDTTQLTKGNDNLYTSPEWTPDGKYVVASKSGGLGGAAKLWLYNVEGGTGVPLLTGAPPTLKTVGAAFGKDGRYIWYAARQGDWQYNAVGAQYQLFVYDRENGKTSQMSTRNGSAFRPALSPDGKYLVYATRENAKTGLRIRDLETQREDWLAYPVQRDETESRAPLDAYPGYTFTPDSRAIIVTYGGEIWRVPVDKSAPSKIPFTANIKIEMGPEVKFAYRVDTTSAFTAHQVRDIAPSPDGRKLAFTSLDRVYVMDLPSGKPVRVSSAEMGEFGPTWSPDSRSLAWVTWSDQSGGQIMRATWPARGGQPAITQLTRTAGLYTDLAWSPAGDRIVVTRAAAREMQDAGAAFFGPAAADFVWIPATGGAMTLIMPSAGMHNAHFTSNPDRIYAYGPREGLVSFRWDGTDMKSHLKVTGPMPPQATVSGTAATLDAGLVDEESKRWIGGRAAHMVTADPDPSEPNPAPQAPPASLVMMSPTGDQAFAVVGMDIYTITVPQVGATPPTVSVANPATATMPVKKLNEIGGEFPTWSADGHKVMWSLANAVWTYDLDRAKVVEDSLKADARAKAAVRRDSAGAPAAAPAAAAPAADTSKKDKPGYKPAEMRIAVTATRDTPHSTILLRGGRALTMKGKEIIDNADVLVRDNRIVAVGARGSVQVPGDAHVIDVTGKTVMPGFVDTHYHPQWLTPNIHTNQVWQYLATLAYGTTTTRDPQTSSTDFLSYEDRVETGEAIGPRIYTTGPGVFSGEQIRDLDHARTILKRYAQYYDTKTLKMYMTGNRQQRQWVIMAAKELGLMPTTEGGLDFKLEITHGLDGYPGVEHTLPITPKYDDVFDWYKATQLTNSPTLIVEYGGPFGEDWFYQSEDLIHDAKLRHFTHPADFDAKVRRRGQGAGGSPGPAGFAVKEEYAMWQHAQDVAKTVAAGGRIGVGSHGQLQGLGMHWEMWLLQSGGLSQHDVLRSATIVGAEAIGMGQDLGSLEPGKLADIIVLDRDPLANIRNTNSVSLVMKNGRVYDANTLDEVYPRQKKMPQQQWMTGAPEVRAGIP